MRAFKLTYFLPFSLIFLVISCNSTKYVPDGYHLVHKNTIVFEGDKLDAYETELIIRQKPNRKFKLYTYNWIDSTKVHKAHDKKFKKIVAKNAKKRKRQNRINEKRIHKARERGDSMYTQRIIPTKDSANMSLTLREWIKFKRGEKPVIFDSLAYVKSVEQLKKFLVTKGYFYGDVKASFEDDKKNPKKRNFTYTITTGKPYIIDSYVFDCPNKSIKDKYEEYMRKQEFNPILNERFDEGLLDAHRYAVAKYFKDKSVYGFSPTSITFEADTFRTTMKCKLIIHVSDRKVKKGDSTVYIPYRDTKVEGVYFHISDTSSFVGSYKKHVDSLDLKVLENGFLRTYDTLFFNDIKYTKQDVKRRKKDGLTVTTEMTNPWRYAYILYNGKPTFKPYILELQNYLENDNTYKEYYIERSYNRLIQLDVFQSVKPDVIEIPGTNKVQVHYYLVPQKRRSFNFEQRFNNSNGFLGLAASVNYNNRNWFRGSEKLTISFGGGFESQPPVFDKTEDGQKIQSAARSFNTFEIGPSIKLDLPGLFLLRSAKKLSKRARPRTVVSAALNLQKRTDFDREIFQFNYMWKFYIMKTQVVQLGVPAAAIKYVRIKPSDAFREKLELSNDLFLKNAYSNQFVWENFKLLYEYNNKQSDKKKKFNLAYNASLTSAGWILDQLKLKDTTETGQRSVFGVGYSRFVRIDNDILFNKLLSKKLSIHARSLVGLGITRGNNTTSLPYDYSFFAGGSNDNRGWRARALGPGAYKYYVDSTAAASQIGDIRLGMFGEVRYNLSSFVKTAFFVDAGNIWTYQNDEKRAGGQFSSNFYKQIALSTGFGLRFDMTFLVVRLDLGFPLTNPALPQGTRWVFQYWKDKEPYIQEGIKYYANPNDTPELQRATALSKLPKPFLPAVQFGIGYPF